MAKTVRDCAILLEAMAGFDPRTPPRLTCRLPKWEAVLSSNLSREASWNSQEYRIDGFLGQINALGTGGIEWLKDAGATSGSRSACRTPNTRFRLHQQHHRSCRGLVNLARYDGVRYGLRESGNDGLDGMYSATCAEVSVRQVKCSDHDRHLVLYRQAFHATAPDSTKARGVRALIKRDFTEAFDQCDLILTPTAPSAASESARRRPARNVFERCLRGTGEPCWIRRQCSVPCGVDEQGCRSAWISSSATSSTSRWC